MAKSFESQGLAEFWDCLDAKAKRNLLRVNKESVMDQVLCTYCRVLLLDATKSLDHVAKAGDRSAKGGCNSSTSLIVASGGGLGAPSAGNVGSIVLSRAVDGKFVCTKRGRPSGGVAEDGSPLAPLIEYGPPFFKLLDVDQLKEDIRGIDQNGLSEEEGAAIATVNAAAALTVARKAFTSSFPLPEAKQLTSVINGSGVAAAAAAAGAGAGAAGAGAHGLSLEASALLGPSLIGLGEGKAAAATAALAGLAATLSAAVASPPGSPPSAGNSAGAVVAGAAPGTAAAWWGAGRSSAASDLIEKQRRLWKGGMFVTRPAVGKKKKTKKTGAEGGGDAGEGCEVVCCDYCCDKLRLRLVDMLTYPRPVRQFNLLVANNLTLGDLRDLMAAEVSSACDVDPSDLVLIVRGKALGRERDGDTMTALGLKNNQQVLVSKKLGRGGGRGASGGGGGGGEAEAEEGQQSPSKETPEAETLEASTAVEDVAAAAAVQPRMGLEEKNKQFVGDLLFGHATSGFGLLGGGGSSGSGGRGTRGGAGSSEGGGGGGAAAAAAASVVDMYRVNQGFAILSRTLLLLVKASVHGEWRAEAAARRHESDLLAQLEAEEGSGGGGGGSGGGGGGGDGGAGESDAEQRKREKKRRAKEKEKRKKEEAATRKAASASERERARASKEAERQARACDARRAKLEYEKARQREEEALWRKLQEEKRCAEDLAAVAAVEQSAAEQAERDRAFAFAAARTAAPMPPPSLQPPAQQEGSKGVEVDRQRPGEGKKSRNKKKKKATKQGGGLPAPTAAEEPPPGAATVPESRPLARHPVAPPVPGAPVEGMVQLTLGTLPAATIVLARGGEPTPLAPPGAPTQQAVGALRPRFCHQCGSGLVTGSKFCSNCGTPVAPPVALPTLAAVAPPHSSTELRSALRRFAPRPPPPPPPPPLSPMRRPPGPPGGLAPGRVPASAAAPWHSAGAVGALPGAAHQSASEAPLPHHAAVSLFGGGENGADCLAENGNGSRLGFFQMLHHDGGEQVDPEATAAMQNIVGFLHDEAL